MAGTMKALRKVRAARGLQMDTVAVPSIGPTDVLVRVKTASICGTDLHIYGWDRWSQGRIKPPVTLGHEFCGTVERVGDEWRLDPAIPEHYGAILDPLGNAVHTVLAGSIAGQTVLVTGCGPIGLMAIAVAKACGSSTVFATETNEKRRAMAKKMGADVVLNPATEDAVAKILAETNGTGVDALLEMSGNPMAIQQGFKALRAGGRASLLGIPTENVPLDLVNDVIFKGATVQGIYGRRMYETWVQMTSLLKAGRLNLEPLFGERAPLDKFENAFTLLQGGMAGKILLYPNGMPR
ncbi:MAG: hypothetical protein AUG83_07785 [Acidobacteria bacterium 13_1_20CM_4_57_11]|nr:MAG: hypothetical protein AUG83_07785 [Acidobacteria bacterium 13_1_20CM_4_57_11]